MLVGFLVSLRNHGVPATLRELLDLHAAMEQHLVFADLDQFYYLSRAISVKDEAHYDKFDRAFSAFFKDIETLDDVIEALIPNDWLRKEFEKQLSQEEKDQIKSLGGLEQLIEEFKKRLEEQQKRHAGGNKWIGTGGTSPFGHGGYNPMGIRIGGEGKNKSAAKVWEKRQYQNLDDSRELGTRNIKVALKRLRKFARTGADEELDLDDTISSTARNAGLLDIKMVRERHNAVKVLLFFDVGGSMDPHIKMVEELFSAARSEFKHMEYFYFHNFIYEHVWQDNLRRADNSLLLQDVLHKYSRDYKVIFVGDASMSPYEIAAPGGSVEHWNERPGSESFKAITDTFDKVAWLNPEPAEYWRFTQSIKMVEELVDGHMFPMTLIGMEAAMAFLSK